MYCHEKGCRLHDFGCFSGPLPDLLYHGGNYVGLGNILNILFPDEGRDNASVKWDTITITVDCSSSISD